jgi:hypothetical protein
LKVFTIVLEGSGKSIGDIAFSKPEVQDRNTASDDIEPIMLRLTEHQGATEEIGSVIFGAVAVMAARNSSHLMLTSAFLLHKLLVKHLPIAQRRFQDVKFDSALGDELKRFLDEFSEVARQVLQHTKDTTNDVDMVDGRLFRVVVDLIVKNQIGEIPQEMLNSWTRAGSLVTSIAGLNAPIKTISGKSGDVVFDALSSDDKALEQLAVLPFTSPVFDKHLSCIRINTETNLPSRLAALKIYRDTTHWHSRKPLVQKLHIAEVKVSKWHNPLRLNQKYMVSATNRQ